MSISRHVRWRSGDLSETGTLHLLASPGLQVAGLLLSSSVTVGPRAAFTKEHACRRRPSVNSSRSFESAVRPDGSHSAVRVRVRGAASGGRGRMGCCMFSTAAGESRWRVQRAGRHRSRRVPARSCVTPSRPGRHSSCSGCSCCNWASPSPTWAPSMLLSRTRSRSPWWRLPRRNERRWNGSTPCPAIRFTSRLSATVPKRGRACWTGVRTPSSSWLRRDRPTPCSSPPQAVRPPRRRLPGFCRTSPARKNAGSPFATSARPRPVTFEACHPSTWS